jgi:hypothetical protein
MIHASDSRIQAAFGDPCELFQRAYPSASFSVPRGTDPDGISLRATVDGDGGDRISDVFSDRLVDLRVENELPSAGQSTAAAARTG